MTISRGLYARVREVLLTCDELDSTSSLKPLFATDQLSPFGARLPEANSKSARVNATISYLVDKKLRSGENALVIFLDTLSDYYLGLPEGEQLFNFARELQSELSPKEKPISFNSERSSSELRTALAQAFKSDELDRFLSAHFQQYLEQSTKAGTIPTDVNQIINWAVQTSQQAQLIGKAHEWNPYDNALQQLAQYFSLSSNTLSTVELQGIVNDDKSLFDINGWRRRLAQIEAQVCRVEVNGKSRGSGFLVGPDILMTNYHVIEGLTPSDSIVARFDYKRIKDKDGMIEINSGTTVTVAEDGVLDQSLYSEIDKKKLEDKNGDPAPEELDYALLRLSQPIGKLSVGKNPDLERGWIQTNPESTHADPGDIVFICQHPDGEPMQLGFDKIQAYNDNHTRVRYSTNTLKGSSGSPCFDRNWNLIALHHSAEKSDTNTIHYNEGIPFPAIRSLLETRDLLSLIDHV